MGVADKWYDEARRALQAADKPIKSMASATSDWTSGTMLKEEWRNFKTTLDDFARNQLGVRPGKDGVQ